ncbi:MAG TPA: M23 family metallopeptidase [Nocardioidaceae bacterium]|jgi:murein DD-endopeptidase MepM/ murein hydrolase activator NlpD|nr:M23 family metallopeptidase [Nocardioidaceae bacterium]
MSLRHAVVVVLLALVCPLCVEAVAPASAQPTEPMVVRTAGPGPVPRLPDPPAPDRPAPAHGVWPLRPRPTVVAAFDPPASRWGPGHRGVDLAGRVGQQVHSALAGRVTFAGRLAGRGVVVVDHGATRTTYEPLTASVAVGDRVAAGAVIGRLELFGSHCLPRACLHWGLIEGRETYLDPLTLVGAAPVVLLPYLTATPQGVTA